MRKILHWVHESVDGFIEGPNGEFDWVATAPELSAYSRALNDRADTFLYGRRVWDMMSAFWPHAESMSTDEHDLQFAPVWRATPKIVFSRTLEKADWNTRVISENIAEELTALKQQPGKDMLLTGGSNLPTTLTRLGLIDEYHIVVHPLVLGGGKPLFQELKDRTNLQLVESRTFDSRTVLLRASGFTPGWTKAPTRWRQGLRPGVGGGAAGSSRLARRVELHRAAYRRIASTGTNLVARGPLSSRR